MSLRNTYKMDIWLLRHGTTEANREKRFQGRIEYPLSSQGRWEAHLLAVRLKSASIDAVLCSDLVRAWETAAIIGKVLNLEPAKETLLRECSWGILEGLTWKEIKKKYPLFYWKGKRRAGLVGGESIRKLLARSRIALTRTTKKYLFCNRIALVSHGRFINAIIAAALGFNTRNTWSFAPSPASVTILKYYRFSNLYRLALFNDCCHLRDK